MIRFRFYYFHVMHWFFNIFYSKIKNIQRGSHFGTSCVNLLEAGTYTQWPSPKDFFQNPLPGPKGGCRRLCGHRASGPPHPHPTTRSIRWDYWGGELSPFPNKVSGYFFGGRIKIQNVVFLKLPPIRWLPELHFLILYFTSIIISSWLIFVTFELVCSMFPARRTFSTPVRQPRLRIYFSLHNSELYF